MELQVTLEGDKRVSTRVGDHLIMTDQPTKSGGADSAPAPFDLFMASIATCAGFYVQSYCQNKGIDCSGITLSLTTRQDDARKKIKAFIITIRIPDDLPDHLHKTLCKVAEQCAVTKTIVGQPEFIVQSADNGD
jgi:ribosomal protein S12 methylthiotransferase accessory factor